MTLNAGQDQSLTSSSDQPPTQAVPPTVDSGSPRPHGPNQSDDHRKGAASTTGAAEPLAVSERKRQASRENGQKSRGPKTVAGKQASRWNALKHGILAKEIRAHAKHLGESRAEFEALYARVMVELSPRDALEEIIAEQIVQCYWRLARVARAEAASAMEEISMRAWEASDVDETENKDSSSRLAAYADRISRGVPESRWVTVFGRYESMLQRQLGRLLGHLERLQRRPIKTAMPDDAEPGLRRKESRGDGSASPPATA